MGPKSLQPSLPQYYLNFVRGWTLTEMYHLRLGCGFYIGTFFLTNEPHLGHLAQGQNLCLFASLIQKGSDVTQCPGYKGVPDGENSASGMQETSGFSSL